MVGRGSMAVSDPAEIAVGTCGEVGKTPMPRRLYRFHCLGGGDAVFDLQGRWLSSIREIRQHADRVALGLMEGSAARTGPCGRWTCAMPQAGPCCSARSLRYGSAASRRKDGSRTMAMTTSFVVQPFEIHRKRLRPARQEPAQTESGALKKAETLARRMPGAAALKVWPTTRPASWRASRSSASGARCRTTSPRACRAERQPRRLAANSRTGGPQV